MTQNKGEAKINQMIEMIKKEAKEESEQIIVEARQKVQKEKNKNYSQAYDQLLLEFAEREVNENTQRRLELSRKTNETRLDIQKHRSVLLAELKNDTETRLRQVISEESKYKPLLKKLILQGAVRLIEAEVFIMCRECDVKIVESIIAEIETEFSVFMKDNMKKDMSTKFTVISQKYMTNEDIGGVILYCNKFKTVFNNSLRSRLDLSFENSIPDIRHILFPEKKKGK